MGSNFNFTLQDLMSNDTTGNNTNPFFREYVKGTPSQKAIGTSAAYLTTQGQSYDTYVGTSMLTMSDVMMGVPLENRASGVLNVQNTLASTALSSQGSAFSSLGIFNALLPADISQVGGSIAASAAASAPGTNTTSTTTAGNGNGGVTPSSGIVTTSSAPGGLPVGSQPNGLPPGYILYPNGGVPVLEFLNLVISKVGDNYVWGATGPNAFDCSGLVLWALQQLGPQFSNWPHFTGSQYQAIKNAGLDCSLTEAYGTAGALLFVAAGNDPAGEHVAISIGNNNGTIEAMNPSLGVRKGNVNEGTAWSVAGLIPGLDYSMVSFGNGISTMPTQAGSSYNGYKTVS